MQNRVRVFSNENIVTNAEIQVFDDKAQDWLDIRRAVSGVGVTLKVGEVSKARLDLVMAHVEAETAEAHVDPELLQATVAVLKAMDYVVVPRWDTAIGFFLARAISLNMEFGESWQLWKAAHGNATKDAFKEVWDAAVAAKEES